MTTHTFEIDDPERWAAAFEELLTRGIGLRASSGRIEVKLAGDVTSAEAEALLNQVIEEHLASKRRRQAVKAIGAGVAHA